MKVVDVAMVGEDRDHQRWLVARVMTSLKWSDTCQFVRGERAVEIWMDNDHPEQAKPELVYELRPAEQPVERFHSRWGAIKRVLRHLDLPVADGYHRGF